MTVAPPPDRPAVGPEVEVAREPVPEAGRSWLLDRLRLDRTDVWLMGGLLLVAFVFRYFSPLMPDVFSGNLLAPVSNCVHNTPVNVANQPGTLCGLSYPYQRSYPQPNGEPSPPRGQVFDEIYFGVDAHNDLKGIAYLDPEPPLSKLIIASGEWLYGWWRATFEGAHGDYADLGFNTYGWRIMSCIFGSLCVPLMYLFARLLRSPLPVGRGGPGGGGPSGPEGASRAFALSAGALVCFDGMFFVQSRIGMIDIFPIFLIMLAYTLFLVHLDSRSERDSVVTLLLVGLGIGLAIAAKWISLAALASIVFWLVARPFLRRRGFNGSLGDGPGLPGGARLELYVPTALVAFVAFPIVIYLASWIPFFTRGQFHSLGDLIAYQQWAFTYHATLKADHPYGSPWWSWPVLYRPVAYYYEYQGLGIDHFTSTPQVAHQLVAGIVDIGNPLIWWASIPAVLSLPYFIIRHRSFPAALIAVGFVTQYLPWSRITRVIFLYHMFGGLVFMILALAFVLGQIYGTRFRWLVPTYLVVVVAAFLFFIPVWTALPISDTAYLGDLRHLGKMWIQNCGPRCGWI